MWICNIETFFTIKKYDLTVCIMSFFDGVELQIFCRFVPPLYKILWKINWIISKIDV